MLGLSAPQTSRGSHRLTVSPVRRVCVQLVQARRLLKQGSVIDVPGLEDQSEPRSILVLTGEMKPTNPSGLRCKSFVWSASQVAVIGVGKVGLGLGLGSLCESEVGCL